MSTPSTRPELACEIVPEGVLAARRQPETGLLAAAGFAAFGAAGPMATFAAYLDKDAPRTGMPGLHTGDPRQREAVVAAIRRVLEQVGGRTRVVTLIVPDQAVRVLLMDFDSLPGKPAEAIPLLRFRLKKMLPFDVDDAAVSYQALPAKTGARAIVAVLPNSVLKEYESLVREAGYEPGIVLPSTLACLGMLQEGETALLVHASTQCVTTAIASGSELLLHRTQELPWTQAELAHTMNPIAADEQHLQSTYTPELPAELLADEHTSNSNLARQRDEILFPSIVTGDAPPNSPGYDDAPLDDAPQVEWQAMQNPSPSSSLPAELAFTPDTPEPAHQPDAVETELQHAFAVAAAYFEDSLGQAPSPVFVAGTIDARTWQQLLGEPTLNLRDLVSSQDLGAAVLNGLTRAQLGAVCGALRG